MPPNPRAPVGAQPPGAHPASDPNPPEESARFRRTLVKVMSMQVIALLVLWWLQARYAH